MNISSIKNKADQLLMSCKPQVIRIMTIMMLVALIPNLFSGSNNGFISLISFILSIVFLTFNHGYIVTTLKIVRNNADELSDDDAFVGFRRFKDLFATYFLVGLFIAIVAFFVVFICIFGFIFLFGSVMSNLNLAVNLALTQGNPLTALLMLLQMVPTLIFPILLMFLMIIIAMVIVSVALFAVPYLLEQYHMKTMKAIKASLSLMKGHMWDLIRLQLSFLGWMILVIVVQSVIGEILVFIPVLGNIIALAIGGFLSIYTYMPRYIVSQAIFFEEIAYYRYEQQANTQEESTYVG